MRPLRDGVIYAAARHPVQTHACFSAVSHISQDSRELHVGVNRASWRQHRQRRHPNHRCER